jgi:hypothetical protein
MRYEDLTAVKMPIFVFWVVTPCGLVGLYFQVGIFSPEDGGSMFLRNVYLQVHTAFYNPEDQHLTDTVLILVHFLKLSGLSSPT